MIQSDKKVILLLDLILSSTVVFQDMNKFQEVNLHLQTAIEFNAQFSGERIVNNPQNLSGLHCCEMGPSSVKV